jgi:hypothetical protein
MTQTSLSAATRAQREGSARNSSFQPRPLALIHPPNPFLGTSHPPLATEFLIANADASSIGILSDQRKSKGHLLIANLELAFHLTHRKISPLRNPNRKFSRVLRAPSCIESFSVRLHPLARKGRRANPHAEGRSPKAAFLIHGTAIKSQRNPFTNSNLRISNRRQTGGYGAGILPAPGGDSNAARRDPSTSLGMTARHDRSLTVPDHMVILAGLSRPRE